MRRNRGVSIINCILIIVIIIFMMFIGMLLKGNNAEEIAEDDPTESPIEVKNYITRRNETKEENIVEYIPNNNIYNNPATTLNEGKKYYYNQLTATGKKVYDIIIKNLSAMKDGNKKIEIDIDSKDVGEQIQTVWDAITMDRPDIFWIDITKIALTTRTTTFLSMTKYEYTLQPEDNESYYATSFINRDSVEEAVSKVEQRVNEIASKCQGSTYDKVKIAHDELIDSINYDQTGAVNNSNVYGALVERTCICEGYAESFKLILDKLNIPAVIVYGDGVDASGGLEAHAWNEVKMDNGQWYAVDVTWDDPIIIGTGTPSGVDYHKNFLKGRLDFEKTHKPDGDVSGEGKTNFKYPELTLTDY